MLFLSFRALHITLSLAVYVILSLHIFFDRPGPIAAVILPVLACTAPTATAAVLHLPIQRRGGAFKPWSDERSLVDIEALYRELQRLDTRFNQTTREFKGNRIVRTAKKNDAGGRGVGGEGLMGNIQMDGAWSVHHGCAARYVSELILHFS